MKNFKQKILALWLFLCVMPLFGQKFSTGAILDPVRYSQIDAKPVLVTRDYTSIPRSASLKQYSPIPEDQSPYGTCAAWSTAFAARTISESIALGRTNRGESSNNVFSPAFLYKNVSKDPDCETGIFIGDALDFMKNQGIVKRMPVEKTIDFKTILPSMFTNSRRYPISGYVRLFSNYWDGPGTIEDRVIPVKKSLSEKKPVVIAMKLPDSFFMAYGKDLWQPVESPYADYSKSAHAMCVVGYDDNKYGGAFEIQNSWGTSWANEGYIWVRYNDFAAFVYEAYEIIENLANYRETIKYEASIEIEVYNDSNGMPVTYDRQGFYKTRMAYPEGTEFQFQMTNRQEAYVYAFSVDNSSPDIERVFPPKGTSPVLDYKESTVAWPGEFEWMRLTGLAGTDYLIVLYAKEALDIDAIERRFASERGTFPQRVERAVGSNFIPYNAVKYNDRKIEFSAQTQNPKAVLGLLLAIERR
jgi:hypothetical protein